MNLNLYLDKTAKTKKVNKIKRKALYTKGIKGASFKIKASKLEAIKTFI